MKRAAINELATEFLSSTDEQRRTILWGDQSDAFVRGTGLVKEFEAFLKMHASIVHGIRPENLSSQARQMLLYRETEIASNGNLRRVLESMEETEIYHDLIFVFIECMLHYDPDRPQKDGAKTIQFVGYLSWNFKFYVQKWLQEKSRQYLDELAPDESLAMSPAGLDGGAITPGSAAHWSVSDDSPAREWELPGSYDPMGLGCIDRYLHVLSLREKQVVSMRSIQGLPCLAVAKKLRVSKGDIIRLTQSAFTKIRAERERQERRENERL